VHEEFAEDPPFVGWRHDWPKASFYVVHDVFASYLLQCVLLMMIQSHFSLLGHLQI